MTSGPSGEREEEPPMTWYVYRWRNNAKRFTLFGRRCRVICRGTMNSALVEFENGQREVISRNALRRER
jgi:hypothetical protein